MGMRDVFIMSFKEDRAAPNNPVLPVILYEGAFKGNASRIEGVFNRHEWLNSWKGGVYEYHHYHTNAHEALGVVQGRAILRLGGENGHDVELRAGDVLALPAGTGHKRISASADFQVVGAYPRGMKWNLWTSEDGERLLALAEIARVPLPDTDPVHGADGPLLDYWRSAARRLQPVGDEETA
ncbi:cupin domain-containing protein [Cohnella fermenti]|uniref:Cupin domain-containing protein n=1 Tax=Cohnella fermenti TaxID=2565925 RepID=A0A4S4BK40_9BACL|nr:cupin domain-containing protein [Cohnella fermenti]THF74498.1 cupin domain-containing protein [Cohnella fermenti]